MKVVYNMNICPECKAENDENSEYCKNCGTRLKMSERESLYQNYQAANSAGQSYAKNGFILPEIDGVPSDDAAAFIGKNSGKILTKFTKMQLAGSKTSWCWPAAILGYFFGLCGVGFWMVYRKMYKLGVILIVADVILATALFGIKGNSKSTPELYADSFAKQLSDYAQNIDAARYDDDFDSFVFILPERTSEQNRGDAVLIFDNFVSIAAVVIGGIYSLYAYKKYAVSKIKSYNISNCGDKYRQVGLMAVGGTAPGFAILTFLLCSALSSAASRIISILLTL